VHALSDVQFAILSLFLNKSNLLRRERDGSYLQAYNSSQRDKVYANGGCRRRRFRRTGAEHVRTLSAASWHLRPLLLLGVGYPAVTPGRWSDSPTRIPILCCPNLYPPRPGPYPCPRRGCCPGRGPGPCPGGGLPALAVARRCSHLAARWDCGRPAFAS